MFLATLRGHRQQGLGTLLCNTSIEIGKKFQEGPIATISPQDLGPKYSHIPPNPELKTYPKICQAIFTSKTSQRVGQKCGFNVDLIVSYNEFEFKGKTFASRIGPSAPDCALVSKIL